MSPESMNARSSVMFSEWNDLHPTPSAQNTHHGQDFRPCLRFHTCWMYVLQLIFFISGNFYFSFVSTLLAYITIPQNKRKTTIIWDKKLTTTHATTSYISKIRAGIYNTLGLQKLTTTYATTPYTFMKYVLVYVRPWDYKRWSVHVKGWSQTKMTGTLCQKENGCNNRVVALIRCSCWGVHCIR